MKLRSLGQSGLRVSEIGFGCGPTAGLMIHAEPQLRRGVLKRALDAGINLYDTAPIYGNGLSETHLGQDLRSLGACPLVSTKVALTIDDMADIHGAVVRSVEASVSRLGLGKIALIQLHNRVGAVRAPKAKYGSGALLTAEDVLGKGGVVFAFEELRRRGLVDSLGCSAYGGQVDVVEQLIDSGAFHTVSVNYSILNRTAWQRGATPADERDYGALGLRAARAGMGVIALRILEGGLLAGDWRDDLPAQVTNATHEALQSLNALHELDRLRAGATSLTELATRFVLSEPAVSSVVIGFSDIAQVDTAIDAARAGRLPADSPRAAKFAEPIEKGTQHAEK